MAEYKAIQIAEFFLSKDKDRKLFTKNLITKNGRTFYEGNARLNKYLHLAQNLYIVKTNHRLFSDDLYAYDNGAVAIDVQEKFSVLYSGKHEQKFQFDQDITDFLNRVYKFLENADLDELIELSHEDSEWVDKNRFYLKEEQRMNSMTHIQEYKEQYADAVKILESMVI